MTTNKRIILLAVVLFSMTVSYAQSLLNNGKVSGNIQMNAQYYIEDSIIEAEKVNNKVRTNTFANIQYTNGGFAAGLRYEYYAHPLIDFAINQLLWDRIYSKLLLYI